eukprot:COSAG01_NODE_3213_length_6410_cov_2.970211_1_plen_63_part_10
MKDCYEEPYQHRDKHSLRCTVPKYTPRLSRTSFNDIIGEIISAASCNSWAENIFQTLYAVDVH